MITSSREVDECEPLLLGPLLHEWPDVFAVEVLRKWLNPTVGRCRLTPSYPC